MRQPTTLAGVTLLGLLVVTAGSIRAESPHGASPQALLADAFGLSRADVGRLERGDVVNRTLDSSLSREIATLGIVRIATTADDYVSRAADIVTFKKQSSTDILQIGRFSDTPAMADVSVLALDDEDVRRLQACQLDDCGVQMSAEAIATFKAIDWRAADAHRRAEEAMRQTLVSYVGRYVDEGAAALVRYADSQPHVDVGQQAAALIDANSLTWPIMAGLRRHILEYPTPRAGARDFVYWSKERVYKRPVISATHVTILRGDEGSPVRYAIASKQIYAMHYFDASLGLTLLLPDTSSPTPATYVVYLNRSRIDLFDGMFGGVTRRIVSGRARSLVATQLAQLQRTLAQP